MSKVIAGFCALFIFVHPVFGQKVDKKLQKQLLELTQGFNGKLGIYVYDLTRNRTVAINADTVFTTASMIKMPILIGIADKLHKGELDYHQNLIYKDSLLVAGVDLLGSFKNNEKIELSKVMMLMLSMSDNSASLWLQSLAGGGTRINEILDSLGCKVTRVNSRTPGREGDRSKYGWGQTSPREMTLLFKKIANRQIIDTAASEKMLRLLGRNYWDENGIAGVPPDAFIASKHGSLNENRNETLYVKYGKSRYIFCICTSNNKDIRWTSDNEAWTLTRKISYTIFKHFNPRSSWKPSVGW